MVPVSLWADALAAHRDDQCARAVAFERETADEIEPWYHASVMADRDNRGEPVADESDPRNFFRSVLRDGLAPAMRIDQHVFRAFLRTFNLLTKPDALMRDGELITGGLHVYNAREKRAP